MNSTISIYICIYIIIVYICPAGCGVVQANIKENKTIWKYILSTLILTNITRTMGGKGVGGVKWVGPVRDKGGRKPYFLSALVFKKHFYQ